MAEQLKTEKKRMQQEVLAISEDMLQKIEILR